MICLGVREIDMGWLSSGTTLTMGGADVTVFAEGCVSGEETEARMLRKVAPEGSFSGY